MPAPTGAVRFKPTVQNALSVWITKPDGRLAKAGFQSGDIVVAVDGKRFDSATAMQETISSLLEKKAIAFGVVREGEDVELVVDGSAFTNPFEMGGSFNPASH
ncbi:MAG: PDZ domain-containing protein [Planctomycetes bacterium]|nr:PDZ domain-containing protein [Planctomycetota bacterium]